MPARTIDTFTRAQIFLGCALRQEPRTVAGLIAQANEDGYCSREGDDMRRAYCLKELVSEGVAEVCIDRAGTWKLRRGPRWDLFYERRGPEVTGEGVRNLNIRAEIDSAFPTPLPRPKAKIIPFPARKSVPQARYLRLRLT